MEDGSLLYSALHNYLRGTPAQLFGQKLLRSLDMERGWRINHKLSISIIGIAAYLLLCIISLPKEALADTYYYTKTEDGTFYYTNIKPTSNDYKSLESPWGVLKTAPKVNRINKSGKYKYSGNYDRHIENTARWYGVDPLLIKAIIKVESNFNPQAVSSKGAMGMMQLMPGTAKKNGVKDAFDPKENIEGGVRYLSKLMLMFNHRLTLALAGYNAGENAVIKYGYKIPPYPETIDYIEKVYIHYDNLRNQKVKRNISSMVAERFDKKKIPGDIKAGNKNNKKKKTSSFVYVETLESETVVINITGKKVSPQKPKIISKPTVRAKSNKADTPVYGDANTDTQITHVAKSNGRYTVQIASFPEARFAKEMENTLKAKTYPVYVQKTDIPGKGTWYRVRVGQFATKEEARQYGDSIKTKESAVNSVYIASN
jgi:cell division septation protein DedD